MNYDIGRMQWRRETARPWTRPAFASRAGCRILGLGGHLPDAVLSNAELAQAFGVSEDWIYSRTGIRERRILPAGRNTSDMALAAATAALADSGVEPGEITHLLLASCAPDGLVPSTACTLERKLGLSGLMAMDFNAACSGFLYGLYLGSAILSRDPRAKILLAAAGAMSRMCDWSDRNVKVLFGDGAAAAVLGGAQSSGIVLTDILLSSDGTHGELLTANGGGSRSAYTSAERRVGPEYFLRMQGREVFKHAVTNMSEVCRALLDRNDLRPEDVDLFVPHQANLRIIEAVGERIAMPAAKTVLCLEHSGNTSAASIPLALVHARETERIKPGDHILLAGFGAGFTWGAALLQATEE